MYTRTMMKLGTILLTQQVILKKVIICLFLSPTKSEHSEIILNTILKQTFYHSFLNL